MSYDNYRRRPARNSKGKERTQLLEELKMEELMLDHFIIRTVASRSITGELRPVDPDLLDRRATCEQKISELCGRLEDITLRPTPKGEPEDFIAAEKEAGESWAQMSVAQKNRSAREQRFHRSYHNLCDAITRTP